MGIAGHTLFVAVMIGSAGLTFLRMTVVALLLPVGDFALYATVVAAGAFLAGPLSFGAIEGTIKSFPRLVAEGRSDQMLGDSGAIKRTTLSRALALAVPLLAIAYFARSEWALLGALGLFVALGNAATGLVASMQRAAGSPGTLAAGTLLRATLTFCAVSAAATAGSSTFVIAVEIASMLAASLISEWVFFRRGRAAGNRSAPSQAPDRSGLLVFLSYTMIAAPFYLDRLYVTATMGEAQAGQYAVLALILVAASLLVNTVAQRAGPDAIKQIHKGATGSALRTVSRWSAATSAVWLMGLSVFGVIVAVGWLPPSLERYAIGIDMLVPLGVTGVLLNIGLLEFLVIGLNRERAWSAAAGIFLTLVLVAAAAVWWKGGGILDLMWALVACRFAYGVLLVAILSRSIAEDGPRGAVA